MKVGFVNVVLTILTAIFILFVALELRRRARKGIGRGAATRPRTTSGGLVLERHGRGPRPSKESSLASPLILGLVILLLAAWLAAAYILPGDRPRSAGDATQAVAPAPPELSSTLAGRLTSSSSQGAEGGSGLMAQAAQNAGAAAVNQAASAREATPLSEAALSVASRASQTSRLDQIGLLPTTQRTAKAANRTADAPGAAPASPPLPPADQSTAAPAAATAQPAPGRNASPPASAQAASQPQSNRNTATQTAKPAPAATADRSGMVAAAASPPAADLIGGEAPAPSASGNFTVHLGSFSDRENAEKYRTKLASSGEMAFISEITVEGRLWYRVMSGRFNSRSNAEAHGRDLKRRGLTADTGNYLIKPVQ